MFSPSDGGSPVYSLLIKTDAIKKGVTLQLERRTDEDRANKKLYLPSRLGSACVSEAAALTMSNYVLHRHSCGFDKIDYEEKLEDLVLLFT